MTDTYIPQSSSSDRYEAARKALAGWSDGIIGGTENAEVSEHDYPHEATKAMAEALRALITPPGVHESEEEIIERVVARHPDFEDSDIGGIVRDAVRAGIQAAHNTWEMEDRPTQEQMLRWLGIEHEPRFEGDRDPGIYIREQYIEREEL